ncbi:hypothetical protein ACIRF8_15115 [Streptomyces sp. NPDC102406]|uniref:hypothetical protein n=1 Tax=Streptomyces sp. NPDC102406 TaxID=3366171 RepID=UPI00381AD840
MTTNEIATRDEQQAVATTEQQTPQQLTTKSALVIWAEEARVVANIAVSIAKTPFAGQLRGKPEEVTAVILAGNELGLQPMAALKAFDIIQGTPALRAHAMRGLVQSKGHKIQLVESDDKHCVMRGRRADDEEWQQVSWDIPRAALLGLVNKSEWKKQPQTMLVARATGELCRLIAADALHAVPYTAEELRDSTSNRGEYSVSRPALSVAALTAATPAAEAQQPDTSDTDDDHATAVAELRAFGQAQGIDDIDLLAHEELGASVEHVGAQAIRDLIARLHAATNAA